MQSNQAEKSQFSWLGDGKLGLALSGGGFRAAFFHVGVLASLAEKDLLRSVSVISTVSGGGIIGAVYYLKVKQLLEGKRTDDLQPDRDGFLQLVREIEDEFIDSVQLNLRVRAFADRIQNARMLASEISSSERLAALFDKYFTKPITQESRTLLKDLTIDRQLDGDAVTPSLILNATTLNTGHQFQFTSSFIGEPPLSVEVFDAPDMPRLNRLRHSDKELSSGQREALEQISLGQAIAATCCVPGLFEPLSLQGLYKDDAGQEVEVRLVDGGVFDNQALVSLAAEDCTHFLCSDASELLQWQTKPAKRIHEVAMRANDIMMDRVRGEVMTELRERPDQNYEAFVLGDDDGSTLFDSDKTRFLNALKNIRTDLDAFTDLEAWALMHHGFSLARHRLRERSIEDSEQSDANNRFREWGFMGIREHAQPPFKQKLFEHLDVGANQFLKVFYLGEPLPWIIVLAPVVVSFALMALVIYLLPPLPRSVWVILGILVVTALAYSQNGRIIDWVDRVPWLKKNRKRLAKAMQPMGVTMILGAIGAAISQLNLQVFNRLYLRAGRVRQASKTKHLE